MLENFFWRTSAEGLLRSFYASPLWSRGLAYDSKGGRSSHPQHQVRQVTDGCPAPNHPGCAGPLPAGASQGKKPDRHLFVITTGGPLGSDLARKVFRELAEQTRIRKPDAAREPTPHSLRHSFAVRYLENLDADADPGRHMLAFATYLGHVSLSSTYWYLESTPALPCAITEAAEQNHLNGGSDD